MKKHVLTNIGRLITLVVPFVMYKLYEIKLLSFPDISAYQIPLIRGSTLTYLVLTVVPVLISLFMYLFAEDDMVINIAIYLLFFIPILLILPIVNEYFFRENFIDYNKYLFYFYGILIIGITHGIKEEKVENLKFYDFIYLAVASLLLLQIMQNITLSVGEFVLITLLRIELIFTCVINPLLKFLGSEIKIDLEDIELNILFFYEAVIIGVYVGINYILLYL